jgi:hypothetical protein
MFELLSTGDWRRLVVREGPGLLASFWIAEVFFKFHSFTLECSAFLATWYVLSGVQQRLSGTGR